MATIIKYQDKEIHLSSEYLGIAYPWGEKYKKKHHLVTVRVDRHETKFDFYCNDRVLSAKEWFENVIYGGEGSFQDMPTCHNFVDVIDEDWDLYYDYGAEYYFAVNNKMHEEDES